MPFGFRPRLLRLRLDLAQRGFDLIESQASVAIVEPEHDLPGLDRVADADRRRADLSGHLRRDV